MSRARAALTAAVLLSAPALAGCSSDDPKPIFAPPASTSPAAPSTSAAAVMSPEDTVRAWVAARNAALQNGDLSAVRDLTAPSCDSCNGILDPIRDVYAGGGSFDTAGWKVVAARVKSEDSTKSEVSTGLVFAGGRTIPKQGAEPVVYGVERHIVVFRLIDAADGWLVSFVGFLS